MGLLDDIRRILFPFDERDRTLVGDVLPRRRGPEPPPFDGRTAALRALRDYVCALRYWRENAEGREPIPFRVRPEHFFVDFPPKEVAVDFADGTVAVVPTGRFRYEPGGLATYVDPGSVDVHGKGTALLVLSTYVETFGLEYRCALEQQRRAWKGVVEAAFAPVEAASVLRLRTRGYYDQPAAFTLRDGQLFDNPDEGRGRRAVQLGVELQIQVVRLVSVVTLVPVPLVNVDVDEATGQPVVLPPGAPRFPI